jgi:YidC/Oxa1 family membrane protein insertase
LTELYLTAYNGAFLGPIAKGLGWIMDKIYIFQSSVLHINSIPLAILLFTIIIYMALLPLTFKQQKFSVLSAKMQPEMKKIQDKYKNKRSDQAAMAAMNEETQALYDKYGISPMGSCVQLLIQMPILFALYRVFYNIPAYITSVKNVFTGVVNGIVATNGYASKMKALISDAAVKNISNVTFNGKGGVADKNHIIDVLYKLSDNGWDIAAKKFSSISDSFTTAHHQLSSINNIFGLNVSDTPWNIMKTSFADHAYLLVILALLFPICSYLSQVINMKVAQVNNNMGDDAAARQMKTMNLMMPFMSLIFAFTVPLGLTIYWIAGAVVRTIQQIFLNKHFAKIDLDTIIDQNKEKAKKKAEKRGIRQAQIYNAANIRTRNANTMSGKANSVSNRSAEIEKANELRKKAKKGSMASKANMVSDYNSKNTKR